MISRNDLHGLTRAPQSCQEFLTRIGGTNPYGEPLFRLILAQNRYQKAAGEWNEWPEDADVSERGGLGIGDIHRLKEAGGSAREAKELLDANLGRKPLRVTRGMVEVEKYACEGWILERWMPAHCYGAPDQWRALLFEGEPALGPYPQYGDYEMVAGPADRLPSLGKLEEAVRMFYRALEEKHPNPAQRMLLRLHELEERRQRRSRDTMNKVEALAKEVDGFRNTLSLGAGRVINRWAETAGIRSHMGG